MKYFYTNLCHSYRKHDAYMKPSGVGDDVDPYVILGTPERFNGSTCIGFQKVDDALQYVVMVRDMFDRCYARDPEWILDDQYAQWIPR